MTDSNDLRRVLSALDEGIEPMPDYADELWAELAAGYESARHSAATADAHAEQRLDTDGGSIDVVVDLSRPLERRHGRGHNALVLAGAAAAIVVLVVSVFFALRSGRDDGTNVATTPGPDQTVTSIDPVVTDQESACATYRAADPTVALLGQEALDGERVLSARDAVERLQADLAASGTADQLVVDRLASVIAILGQAALEIERGLDEQAARTIELANQTIGLAFDTDGDGIPETCLLP